jgi:hypothetical protein
VASILLFAILNILKIQHLKNIYLNENKRKYSQGIPVGYYFRCKWRKFSSTSNVRMNIGVRLDRESLRAPIRALKFPRNNP